MRAPLLTNVLSFCALLAGAGTRAEETLNIAVAANAVKPIEAIVRAFEQQYPGKLQVLPGSTGKLYAQIQQGAPFDAFFSADQRAPMALEQTQRTVPGSRFTYALGRLALWSPRPGLIRGEDSLSKHEVFNKIALANPKLAPYGEAAVQVLEKLGLRAATEARWVMGENIAQTFQFVSTGNAELGFVALSQLVINGEVAEGYAWRIPPHYHAPIRQDAVLLRRAENKPLAFIFWQFVRSPSAEKIFLAHGYELPADLGAQVK